MPSRALQDDLRGTALAAWRAGVEAVDPSAAVAAYLDEHPALRRRLDSALVVATGKAAASMVRGLGPSVRGFALVPAGSDAAGLASGVEVLEGDHPVPSRRGMRASRRILDAVRSLGRDDDGLLLYLVSGGTSALFEVPRPGLVVDDVIALYRRLLGCGAGIEEVNRVRRRLSLVKGGGLARSAYPAAVVTLAVSDVAGDDPVTIGSGPTVAHADAPETVAETLARYGLAEQLPASIRAELGTPQTQERSRHEARIEAYEVLLSCAHAERAARAALQARGYAPVEPPVQRLEGDVGAVAPAVAECIDELLAGHRRGGFAVGGETTVALGERPGRGGRNQHLAALVACALAGREGFACMAGGTDGVDGVSEAAGALVDGFTAARAGRQGSDLADAVARFDTDPALAAAGAAVVTGPTGTNVGDLLVAVARPRARETGDAVRSVVEEPGR